MTVNLSKNYNLFNNINLIHICNKKKFEIKKDRLKALYVNRFQCIERKDSLRSRMYTSTTQCRNSYKKLKKNFKTSTPSLIKIFKERQDFFSDKNEERSAKRWKAIRGRQSKAFEKLVATLKFEQRKRVQRQNLSKIIFLECFNPHRPLPHHA